MTSIEAIRSPTTVNATTENGSSTGPTIAPATPLTIAGRASGASRLPRASTVRATSSAPCAARFLPLTHALVLMRYGLLHDSSGLHSIWHMHSTTGSAALSLAVVALFAVLLTTFAVKFFTRAATQ
jgi:hypothetical protein